MTMLDAASDRDYADWLYSGEPEGEDPENVGPEPVAADRPEFGPQECPF